ncbi:MAG: hypothetical protein RJA63_138 [Pseudomonadota bacterium]|jgi:phage protein U
MTRPLFQLGSFQFDLPNGVPQTLDRTAEYRWEGQDRLLRDPAVQFLGPGSQEITLDGQLFPGFSGRQSTMETLRELATQGQPQMLTDGLGLVYGKWAIKQIREGLSTFAPGGGARQIGFSISLVRYVEDNPGDAASPLALAFNSTAAFGLGSELPSFTEADSAFKALDWASDPQFSAMTTQAQQGGFSLGQLATIATTGARIAQQVSSGQYVNAALGAFGALGIPVDQSDAWTQIGISAARLAESYANGNGPTGMALAMEVASSIGAPALQQLGIVAPEDLQSINSLLESTATVTEILKVDPAVTESLRPLIVLTGG